MADATNGAVQLGNIYHFYGRKDQLIKEAIELMPEVLETVSVHAMNLSTRELQVRRLATEYILDNQNQQ